MTDPAHVDVARPGTGVPGHGTRGGTSYDQACDEGRWLAENSPARAADYAVKVRTGDIASTPLTRGRAAGIEAGLAAAQRCRACGRPLSDPASIEAGIGPDCAARLEEA